MNIDITDPSLWSAGVKNQLLIGRCQAVASPHGPYTQREAVTS